VAPAVKCDVRTIFHYLNLLVIFTMPEAASGT
jgi:hypothetical protein